MTASGCFAALALRPHGLAHPELGSDHRGGRAEQSATMKFEVFIPMHGEPRNISDGENTMALIDADLRGRAGRSYPLSERSDRNPARTSSEKSCGCSQAAKCPPLGSLL